MVSSNDSSWNFLRKQPKNVLGGTKGEINLTDLELPETWPEYTEWTIVQFISEDKLPILFSLWIIIALRKKL